MTKILFEDKGPNYQVPGLPYDEVFKYVRAVIFESIPSSEEIKELLANSDKSTLINPYSLDVIKGFRDYIPTTFTRVTKNMPKELIEEHFGVSSDWVPEPERILLQLQTEIEAKSSTIDAAITHHRRELSTVVNKAHLLNRLYMIGRLYGHLQEREYPFLFGNLTDPSTWDSALSDMRLQAIDYILELPVGKRKYPRIVREVDDVSKKELNKKYCYVEWLKEKLGDNLIGILLYGSAATTDNPEEYLDFDNWVRVRDVKKAHEVLKGTCPAVYDGKVIECRDHKYPEGAKHLGILLFPESEEYLLKHIRFLHDSREFLKHTRVLYGEFPFQKIRQDEVVERGISAAYIKLKTVGGSLNWAYSAPEKIVGKPNLFEYIVKNTRFFLQHSLNILEGPKFRGKKELTGLLAKKGIHIPKYKSEPDLQHIQDSFIDTLINVLGLQKELIDSGIKPNLEFLVDDKTYEWHSEEIEDWSRSYDE